MAMYTPLLRTFMAPIAVPTLNDASESENFSGFIAPVKIMVLFLMALNFLAVSISVSSMRNYNFVATRFLASRVNFLSILFRNV